MYNILLGVTGSVAAIKLPELLAPLESEGQNVRIVATRMAGHFFDVSPLRQRGILVQDSDEWPERPYSRGDEVRHVELRKWADVLVVAPLDANTLAKFAAGLCDNCLTCVYRCWDPQKPIVIAPAMNTLMWQHPATARNLRQLREDIPRLHICGPQEKLLACGDTGNGAMADIADIVAATAAALGMRGIGPTSI